MFQCPYFFFDVVYIHNGADEKAEEPSWQDMFAFMGSLDTKGTSYKYEVALAGPALELHNCMAKLLAHPCSGPARATPPTACWRRRRRPSDARPGFPGAPRNRSRPAAMPRLSRMDLPVCAFVVIFSGL